MQTQSEKIDEIIPALVLARRDFKVAVKRESSHHGKYADLAEVMESSLDPLLSNDLFVSQHPISIEGIDYLKTQVSHKSGQFLCSYTTIICAKQNDPQAQGSAITYVRRYGYEALLGIQRADDDGQGAMGDDDGSGLGSDTPKTKSSGGAPSEKQISTIQKNFSKLGWDEVSINDFLRDQYGVASIEELDKKSASTLIGDLFDGKVKKTEKKAQDDIPF